MHEVRREEMRAEEEEDLIEACRRGDPLALERVLRAHAPTLERLLGRLVGPRADVEDLLQETLTEAITSFAKFRGDSTVRTWLCRIAVHVVHAHRRRPYQRRTVLLELAGDQDLDPRTLSPDRRVDARRDLARLYVHLDAIAPKLRDAFILHVLEDLPLEEVAKLMRASRVATASRVFRGRRELMRRMRDDDALRARVLGREGGR